VPVIGRGTRRACGLWFPSSAPPRPRAVPPFETAKRGAAQGMDGSQVSRVEVISGFRRSGRPPIRRSRTTVISRLHSSAKVSCSNSPVVKVRILYSSLNSPDLVIPSLLVIPSEARDLGSWRVAQVSGAESRSKPPASGQTAVHCSEVVTCEHYPSRPTSGLSEPLGVVIIPTGA